MHLTLGRIMRRVDVDRMLKPNLHDFPAMRAGCAASWGTKSPIIALTQPAVSRADWDDETQLQASP